MCGLVCKLEIKKQMNLRKKCLSVSYVVVSLNGIFIDSLTNTIRSLWSLGLEWDWEWKCNEMRLVRVFLGASSLLVTRNLRILSFSLNLLTVSWPFYPKSSYHSLKPYSSFSALSLSLHVVSTVPLLYCSLTCSSPMLSSTTRQRLNTLFSIQLCMF